MFDLSYFNDSDRYELDYAERTEDISFYLNYCRNRHKGSSILELGCGTGRITLPIASEGYHITGIDNSRNLLSSARKKADIQDLNVNFLEADFRNFKLSQKFNLIIAPFNALQHAYSEDEIKKVFESVKKHMGKTADFVFDVNNPEATDVSFDNDVQLHDVFKAYYDGNGILKRYIPGKTIDCELIDIIVENSIKYNAENRIIEYTFYYSMPDRQDFMVSTLFQRMFEFNDLSAYLKDTGFKIKEKFGGFKAEPFDNAHSPSLVVVATLV
jgi:2-polyprenyl-3-methyl-5-hydroxy-6-metoxy-1,4-benzoquinol methylase